MSNKGQAVISEYSMAFFIVVGALTAMTVFVQRCLQARIHDTRNYMISYVMNSGACDANCLAATGNFIPYQYEPYYQITASNVFTNDVEGRRETQNAVNWGYGRFFYPVDKTVESTATTEQLPPECADGANPKPTYCP